MCVSRSHRLDRIDRSESFNESDRKRDRHDDLVSAKARLIWEICGSSLRLEGDESLPPDGRRQCGTACIIRALLSYTFGAGAIRRAGIVIRRMDRGGSSAALLPSARR